MDLSQVLQQYGAQGIFCGLFIYTYLNNINVNKQREDKYIETINNFTKSIDDLKVAINNMNEGGK